MLKLTVLFLLMTDRLRTSSFVSHMCEIGLKVKLATGVITVFG